MGALLRMLGTFAYLMAGVVGLVISLQILADIGGVLLATVGFVLFPAALGIAPWIPLLTDGDFTPVLVVYGLGFLGIAMATVGQQLADRTEG